MPDGYTIGIDLGTTNSVAAAVTGDSAEVIPNDVGERTTPSVVAFPAEEDHAIVGRPALNQAAANPERTVQSIKRRMGQEEGVEVDGQPYAPEEVSALVLEKLVDAAEDYLGSDVTAAVITVPAYFTERQREATKRAGELAGLTVERVVNEPTAACLAYGLDDDAEEELALVYDLGGGTFDVSVVELGYGVVEVVATSGDTELGGDDWDDRVVDWLLSEFEAETGIDLTGDRDAMARVREAARTAKHDLSTREQARVAIPYVAPGEDLEATLTRERFDDLTGDLLSRTVDVLADLLDEEGYAPEDFDTTLLVGGATRMPQVEAALTEFLGTEPSREVHPDEAVALGAADHAASLAEDLPDRADDAVLVDVTPRALGVELADGSFDVLVERNETVPTTAYKDTYSTHRENQDRISVRVYQGESPVAAENELLDRFTLSGIHPAPAGEPRIGIEFHLDESGILHVEAEDLDRNEAAELTIESVFSRTEAELSATRDRLPDVE